MLMKWTLGLVASAALFGSVGLTPASYAAEPVLLTMAQMDGVTAAGKIRVKVNVGGCNVYATCNGGDGGNGGKGGDWNWKGGNGGNGGDGGTGGGNVINGGG